MSADEILIDIEVDETFELDLTNAQIVAMGRQVDLSNEDPKSLEYVKNKSTKYLKNEGEDGTSPYATQEYVKKNGGKIDSMSLNGDPLKIDENKNVNLENVVVTTQAYIFDGGNSLGEIDE